jgi:hypothetical protein
MLQNQNRFGENKFQAQANARRELNQDIPERGFISFKKDDWEKTQIKKLKKQHLFDTAALLGEKMYRGIKKSLFKRYKEEYQQVFKLA